jgi:ribosomal protein S18 acetylase RimI-like enzyme
MQSLQQELWQAAGPRVLTHVGDLAWWVHRTPVARRLWLEGDRCVAWAWIDRGTALVHDVHPEFRAGPLHEEVLDWFEAEAEPGANGLQAWAMDGDDVAFGLLARRGFERPARASSYEYYVRALSDLPEVPPLRDGFRLRAVHGDEDMHERVEVHRATWEPSRVTEESYRNVMRAWPYRGDLDCVVEAPDGRFAAYALAWYDDANRVGELEPVGTYPDFRRLGLGAAVCRYAFSRLRDAGAEQVIVYSESEPAQRLYESVGFRRHAILRSFTKVR